jgi:hypothetical protein
MNSVPASATRAAPQQSRSLDLLWAEVAALQPTKLTIETPGFLTKGAPEVTVIFGELGGSNLRIVSSKVDVRDALEDVLAQAAAYGKRGPSVLEAAR